MIWLSRCTTLLVSVVLLSGQVNVLTWHNDNARTGLNPNETILTPANVTSSKFGKLAVLNVDGKVDAQPLYVPAVAIPNAGVHNVVYIATEHGSLYAFDADTFVQLRKVSLIPTNETPSDDHGCGQVTPEIGITATPAIDLQAGPTGMIFATAQSKDANSHYHHRLHALDLPTLTEQLGGPVEIQGTYQGNGVENTFNPAVHTGRPGLLISNGVVYTSWGSHCDAGAYVGWVLSYSETTLAQVGVLNLVPNGNDGGIWGAGSGPATDSKGNVFLMTGNGTFDPVLNMSEFPSMGDYGNAFVKISTSSPLAVTDYFTMLNTVSESGGDVDLGSGGLMLLPPLDNGQGTGTLVSLVVGAGKDSNIYVLDQTNLGKFNPSTDSIYQLMSGELPGGAWSSPAWFNGYLYYGGVNDYLKAFAFTGGQFSLARHSSNQFVYPGTTPSISSNGTTNGIVWTAENQTTAVLHAYDATNVSTELYNSNQAANGRDHFGTGNKFIVPTVANGKVYVGTTNGVGVFGLLAPLPTNVSVTPNSGSGINQLFAAAYSDAQGYQDINLALFMVANNATGMNGCFVMWQPSSNAFYLGNDAATAWLGPVQGGTSSTIQNGQCTLNAATSSGSGSGNTLTVNFGLSFKIGFAGTKNTYEMVFGSSGNTPWQQAGTWTVGQVPTNVSVAPSSGSGASQVFTATYSDTLGYQDIGYAFFMVAGNATGVNGCFVMWIPGSNLFYLGNDAATAWLGPVHGGTSATVENSQCSLNGASSSGNGSGTVLTVNFGLNFKAAFTGAKNTYEMAFGGGGNTAWQQRGTWTPATLQAPTNVSVMPNAGGGSSQVFTATYSDAQGYQDIRFGLFMVAGNTSGVGGCFVMWQPGNWFYLGNDAANAWLGPIQGGTTTILENSQCSLNGAASFANGYGNTLTIDFAINFKSGFTGTNNTYQMVFGSGGSTNWQPAGTWIP